MTKFLLENDMNSLNHLALPHFQPCSIDSRFLPEYMKRCHSPRDRPIEQGSLVIMEEVCTERYT